MFTIMGKYVIILLIFIHIDYVNQITGTYGAV